MTNEYENTLRIIISNILGFDDDTDFGIPEDRKKSWLEKREVERKKYRGIIGENRLIFYSEFYDLKTIIFKHWEKFKPILKDKKRFEVFFEEVQKFRNTTAHGRTLYLYQENLLKGIIYDLKLQLVLYHDKNMNVDDYFLKILKASDSLGNNYEYGDFFSVKTDKILRVGDTLEFNIEAFDPKGRKITYVASAEGHRVESENPMLSLTISQQMIGKFTQIMLKAITKDSDYENSAYITFVYIVLP